MSNEEPQYTQEQNVELPSESHKLPEQSRLPECSIPRPFTFEHLIHQWQPMGIRVTLNLPFTGNDQDYIFAIRNGPFIPSPWYKYQDSSAETLYKSGGDILDPTKRKFTTMDTYQTYAFNNMRPVLHAGPRFKTLTADQAAIYITQYDQPPILASLSTMFRKWRGTMHYRVRTVAGFTTQGYIFSSMVRNSPGFIGIYPTQNTAAGVQREDSSYRESMINSYVMGDTAMFRHFEVEVPFEYPVPFYDQFNWIGNRSRPANNFMWGTKDDKSRECKRIRNIRNEPHGDNFVLFGLRGKLESSVQNSQITFELEYRAGDDFQFAEPFLPFNEHYLTPYANYKDTPVNIVQVPSDTYQTDGLHQFIAKKQQDEIQRPIPKIIEPQSDQPDIRVRDTITTTIRPSTFDRTAVNNPAPRRAARIRTTRETHPEDGYDTVDDDDLKSEVGDPPELLDFKRNLRKSLQNI